MNSTIKQIYWFLTTVLWLSCTSSNALELSAPKHYPYELLDWKQLPPIDLSFLNAQEKPAGKHGFLQAKKDSLIFEDGTPARFWGVNIAAYTLFHTPKHDVELQAKRLSSLGINLVRIHHHDSPWVNPNIFGSQDEKQTSFISASEIDKIDWWIACLKNEGIYVWLDLHVQRSLKAGDATSDFSELRKGGSAADLKGFNYMNLSVQQAMRNFNHAYLGHLNPYTGKTYLQEPAIAAVLITNENDLTHHFGHMFASDKEFPHHNKRLIQEAKLFAKKHQLSTDATLRTWEAGPSKLFLNDMEHRFNDDIIKDLRRIGVKVPIVTTSFWGEEALSALPSLNDGDIIDVHSYQNGNLLGNTPKKTANLTHWIAAAQVIDKPLSVSEWNADPFPESDRHMLPMLMAGQASFQGWDALMLYAYAQSPLDSSHNWTHASNWDSVTDPSIMSTMPAAALAYRRGDIAVATSSYVLDFGKNLFYQDISPKNAALIRTASELGKLQIAIPATKELSWLKPSVIPKDLTIYSNPHQILTSTTSQPREFNPQWDQGIITINTARTQAASGLIGNKKIRLNNVEFNLLTPKVTIFVQSLDGTNIKNAKKILISLATDAKLQDDNTPPFTANVVEGNLSIEAAKGLKLYKHKSYNKKHAVPVEYNNGRYIIQLNNSSDSYWLTLQ